MHTHATSTDRLTGPTTILFLVVLGLSGQVGCRSEPADGPSGCPFERLFEVCPDGGAADQPPQGTRELPRSCVAGVWQIVGMGRCTTDEDCAHWSDAGLVPDSADPPFSRCIEFPRTGERFCERFGEPGYDACLIGFPCYPAPSLGWAVPPSAMERECVTYFTRDGADGAPVAQITACVRGTPTFLDDRCYPVGVSH